MAEDTINILNLNSRHLIKERQEVIAFFDEEIDGKTDAEVCQVIEKTLTKNQEGKYEPYWTMIKYTYSNYLRASQFCTLASLRGTETFTLSLLWVMFVPK